MKAYVKPTIEVINMKTAESIADDTLIKTIWTKAASVDGQPAAWTQQADDAVYNPAIDHTGSTVA